jgi:hypothetical protein
VADDARSKVPYLQAPGNITKVLDRIAKASIPPKFNQDFLSTTLDMKGGSARPVLPFLKRAGFIGTDGTPTDLYKQFKNPSARGAASAQGLRNAYKSLYDINEYVHSASDKDLKGIILQVTGLAEDSKLVPSMVASFKALKAYADFDADLGGADAGEGDGVNEGDGAGAGGGNGQGTGLGQGHLNLGYTINLNLPATNDIAVFNAIFKSLKEHLL